MPSQNETTAVIPHPDRANKPIRGRGKVRVRGRGRPPGAVNLNPPTVTSLLTRCPACGSTRRDEYYQRSEQAHDGLAPDGKPYTHIVRRRTRCADCGQHRIDKTYENRISANPRNA